MRIAKVVLRESVRQTDKLFSYVVDSSCLFCELLIGHYVFVPFGRSNKQVLAVVVEIEELDDKTEDISKLKSITSIVDPLPVLRADVWPGGFFNAADGGAQLRRGALAADGA